LFFSRRLTKTLNLYWRSACPHGYRASQLSKNRARIDMLNKSETNQTDVPPRAHQRDQDRFHAIRAEDAQWITFAAYPPTIRLAILVGDPTKPGPYTIRVRVPGGIKMMPHKHPEDRIYTVLTGVFYVGLGEQFDEGKLSAYAPGSIVILPGNQPHFHWAKSGEYMTQITAIGPLGFTYIEPNNDPRTLHSP
jgi:quercetin dioxygenase-like cupin family protein